MDLERWTGGGGGPRRWPGTRGAEGDADCTYELAANSQRRRSARDAEDERMAPRRRSKGEGEKVASRRIDQRDELPSGRRWTIANSWRRETQCSTDPTTAGRIGTGYEMPGHTTPRRQPRTRDEQMPLSASKGASGRERIGLGIWSRERKLEEGGQREEMRVRAHDWPERCPGRMTNCVRLDEMPSRAERVVANPGVEQLLPISGTEPSQAKPSFCEHGGFSGRHVR